MPHLELLDSGNLTVEDLIRGSFPPEIEMTMEEFMSPHRVDCDLYQRHYGGTPPFPKMDQEDPDRDKTRIVTTLPELIVDRGVRSLFGNARFSGFEALVYPDDMSDGEKRAHKFLFNITKMAKKLRETEKETLITGEGWLEFLFLNVGEIAINELKTCDVDVVLDRVTKEKVLQVIVTTREGEFFYRRIHTPDAVAYYVGVVEERPTGNMEGSAWMRKPEMRDTVVLKLTDVVVHMLGIIPCTRLMHEKDKDTGRGVSVLNSTLDKFDAINHTVTNVLFAHEQQLDPLVFATGVRKGADLWRDADAVWYFANERAMLRILEWNGVPATTKEMVQGLVKDVLNKNAIPPAALEDDPRVYDLPYKGLRILFSDWVDLVGFRQQDVKDFVQEIWRILITIVNSREVVPADIMKRLLNVDPVVSSDEMVESIPKLDPLMVPTEIIFGPVIRPDVEGDRSHGLELFARGVITGERLLELSHIPDLEEAKGDYKELKELPPPIPPTQAEEPPQITRVTPKNSTDKGGR